MVTPEHRLTLLEIADQSLHYCIQYGRPYPVQPQQYPLPLQEQHACFVTLRKAGDLRGCIGSLEARQSLVENVAVNACAAGCRDPRFPALGASELKQLDIQISVLSPSEPLQFDSEAGLLKQIRPKVDGLILQEGDRRGTFLPSVWESLPEPELFLRHLKVKAGLPEDYWSPSIQVWRYTTESFSRPATN